MTIRNHLAAALMAGTVASLLAAALACVGEAKVAAPPATAANPDDLACHKDADCKGDRLCDGGRCVAPPGAATPSPPPAAAAPK